MKAVTDLERDGLPMALEPFEGVRRASVVGVQCQEQLARASAMARFCEPCLPRLTW